MGGIFSTPKPARVSQSEIEGNKVSQQSIDLNEDARKRRLKSRRSNAQGVESGDVGLKTYFGG